MDPLSYKNQQDSSSGDQECPYKTSWQRSQKWTKGLNHQNNWHCHASSCHRYKLATKQTPVVDDSVSLDNIHDRQHNPCELYNVHFSVHTLYWEVFFAFVCSGFAECMWRNNEFQSDTGHVSHDCGYIFHISQWSTDTAEVCKQTKKQTEQAFFTCLSLSNTDNMTSQ